MATLNSSLADKWNDIKNKLKPVKKYVKKRAIKGDAVDELWVKYINKHELDLEVKRTGPGAYLFGTKKIIAKTVNDKLIVRVGGGSMGADDFIIQYGAMEIAKRDELNDRVQPLDSNTPTNGGRKSISTRDPQIGSSMKDIKSKLAD